MDGKVLDILEEYLTWEKVKTAKKYSSLTQAGKDELRLRYDSDAAYYYKTLGMERDRALCADTIISFWTIYKSLLKLEAGWSVYKTVKSLERLIFQIKKTQKNDYTGKIRGVNEKVEEFAKICYSKGNYMLLPLRRMNMLRYEVAEDRIDLTLYECFGGGKLANCFKNDEAVKAWVLEQGLDLLFENREVDRNNIKWFLQDNMKKISEMSADEIYQYLERATQMIQERGSQL